MTPSRSGKDRALPCISIPSPPAITLLIRMRSGSEKRDNPTSTASSAILPAPIRCLTE
jgi:hypothetical protein